MIAQTDYTFEIETVLEGDVTPAEPASWDSPGYGAEVDSMVVKDLYFLRFNYKTRKHDRVDLLRGVDRKSPEIKRLLNNIAEAIGEDADDALIYEAEEASEPDGDWRRDREIDREIERMGA